MTGLTPDADDQEGGSAGDEYGDDKEKPSETDGTDLHEKSDCAAAGCKRV